VRQNTKLGEDDRWAIGGTDQNVFTGGAYEQEGEKKRLGGQDARIGKQGKQRQDAAKLCTWM